MIYTYREDCGWTDTFDAETDDDAITRAEQEYRSASNPDFDGDSARLLRIDTDEDGDYEAGVTSWDGDNMIPDTGQLRDR